MRKSHSQSIDFFFLIFFLLSHFHSSGTADWATCDFDAFHGQRFAACWKGIYFTLKTNKQKTNNEWNRNKNTAKKITEKILGQHNEHNARTWVELITRERVFLSFENEDIGVHCNDYFLWIFLRKTFLGRNQADIEHDQRSSLQRGVRKRCHSCRVHGAEGYLQGRGGKKKYKKIQKKPFNDARPTKIQSKSKKKPKYNDQRKEIIRRKINVEYLDLNCSSINEWMKKNIEGKKYLAP